MNSRFILGTIGLFLSSAVWAATPVIYSRGEISITPVQAPAAAPPEIKSKDEKDKTSPAAKEEAAAPVLRELHRFHVEIRPEKAFIQNAGMFTQPVLDEKSGIMAVIDEPGLVPIVGDNIYTPLDILFVNTQGKISQIAPSVNLSELSGEIAPKEPVRAFIYLQSGICKKFDIRPGDMIGNEVFHKNPIILN